MGDHIDRSLVHLVLDGAVQHVERFTGALVQELVQQEREPEDEDKHIIKKLSLKPYNLRLNPAKRLN